MTCGSVWRTRTRPCPPIQSALFWNSRGFAFHLREAGRADEASRVMRRARAAFERMPGRTPADLYNLACVRALCAELPPGADKDPTFEDDPEERRRFADQSVEALSKAIDAGHRDLNLIRTDNDLKSIRDRADVKALIAGLDAIIKAEEAKTTVGTGDRLKTQAAILAHRERLAATDAGNARLKGDLAATKHAVGLIQIELGKVADANRSFAEEMAIREALVAADPKAVTPRADLIMARIDLGEIAWKAGRLAEGAKVRHAGLEMLKRLARERPEDVALRRRQEGTERALGGDYARLGLWEEAARFRIVDPGTIGIELVRRRLADATHANRRRLSPAHRRDARMAVSRRRRDRTPPFDPLRRRRRRSRAPGQVGRAGEGPDALGSVMDEV